MKMALSRKAANDDLDDIICKQMSSLIELLTTSGKPTLISEVMKKFKRLCRTSDAYVRHAYELLMIQLVKDHSEIRLSTFQMIDELFNRSHVFRELVVEDFQTLLELSVEIDRDCPLPPPKLAANTLKNDAYKCIQQWYEKFGETYKKLALGYDYLKSCKKVNFDAVSARIETERRQKEETERKLEENRLMKLEQVHNQMNDLSPDIGLCLKEIENCIQLLLPHPDMFFIPESEGAEEPLGFMNKTRSEKFGSENDKPVNDSLQHSNKVETEIGGSSDCKATLKTGRNFPVDDNTLSDRLSGDDGKCKKSNSSRDHSAAKMNTDISEQKDTQCAEIRGNEKQGHESICICDKTEKTVDPTDKIEICRNNNSSSENNKSVELCERTHNAETAEKQNIDGDQETSGDDSDDSDDEFEDVWDHSGLRQAYGLGSSNYEISVTVGAEDRLRETEDNKDIIQSLKDQYRLVKTKYLTETKRWLQTLESNCAKQEDIKKVSDLKTKLEEALKKCVELEVLQNPDKDDEDSSDSDDDFEEVVEKEGYEEDIPEHIRLQSGNQEPSTSKQSRSKSKSSASK